jgi:hypothetical protein
MLVVISEHIPLPGQTPSLTLAWDSAGWLPATQAAGVADWPTVTLRRRSLLVLALPASRRCDRRAFHWLSPASLNFLNSPYGKPISRGPQS